MVEQSIVTVAKNYLRSLKLAGVPVQFAVLFGSWVHGTPHRWSDIDLLVVSPQFDNATNRQYVDLLWRQAARVDSRIEPIACGERQWKENHSSPILEIARREGQCIALDEEPAQTT